MRTDVGESRWNWKRETVAGMCCMEKKNPILKKQKRRNNSLFTSNPNQPFHYPSVVLGNHETI